MDEPTPPVGAEPAKPKKKPRKLTNKHEEALARSVVSHPNDSLAEHGERAKYAPNSGADVHASSAWRTLQRPHVKARIQELMNMRPATSLKGLHKTLEDGLKATDTKFFAHEGEVISKRTVKDHVTRHKYLETALELHGAREKEVGGVTNNFFTKEAIEAFVEAFKRKPA